MSKQASSNRLCWGAVIASMSVQRDGRTGSRRPVEGDEAAVCLTPINPRPERIGEALDAANDFDLSLYHPLIMGGYS